MASPGPEAGSARSSGSRQDHSAKAIWMGRMRDVFSRAHWMYFIRHSAREANKRRAHYALGLFSVFLVVLVAGVCYTLIARAPVVFLQAAEGSRGQVDLVLTASSAAGSSLNYTALSQNVAANDDSGGGGGGGGDFAYSAPRTRFDAFLFPLKWCDADLLDFAQLGDVDWAYTGLSGDLRNPGCGNATLNCVEQSSSSLCRFPSSARQGSVAATAISTSLEQRMGLGRLWPYASLLAGELIISADLARLAGVRAGDKVLLKVSSWGNSLQSALLASVARGVEWTASSSSPLAEAKLDANSTVVLDAFASTFSGTLFLPFTVKAVATRSYGKFGSDDDGTGVGGGGDDFGLVVEGAHLLASVLAHAHPALRVLKDARLMADLLSRVAGANVAQSALLAAAASDSVTPVLSRALPSYPSLPPASWAVGIMSSYASHVAFNLPPGREKVYIATTDYDSIQARVISWSSRLVYFSGFSQADVSLPLLEEMSKVKQFSLYLGLILSIILTILFLLSILLIYSLLMISIETRTFELGVHRMCGMSRWKIVWLLLVQALSFAVPAWVLGLVTSQVIAAVVVGNLEKSVEVPLDKLLTSQAIGVATLMGLLIPLVACILPIRAALAHNLHDALDTRHSKTAGVVFSIERSVDQGPSAAWMSLGVAMSVLGGAIYYGVPLALVSFNLTLFFQIFFALILGMLMGLIILSLNLQPLLERAIVFLTLWWERPALTFIVVKNLVTHRVRNRKTSVMFALSLGFILLITMLFAMELWTARARMYKQYGSEMQIYPRTGGSFMLSPSSVRALETLLASYPIVRGVGWVTPRLTWNGEFDDSSISNLGHAYTNGVEVYGVSSNFFEQTLNEYMVVDSNSPAPSASPLAEQLYTVAGSQAAILGTSAKQQFGLADTDGTHTSFLYALQKRASDTAAASLQFHRMKPLVFLDNCPRFMLGRFPSLRPQPTIVSLPTFQRLSNNAYPRIGDIPMSYCAIRLFAHATDAQKDLLATALVDFANSRVMSFWDLRRMSSQLEQSNAVMSMIFSIATYIAMFLCLFSLVASMLSNIYEQSKEISVLRSLGLPKTSIVKIYTYEAFVLVMSSSILGLAIGFVMSATLVAQRILLTQMEVPLQFPWTVLIYVFSGSIICAVVSSFLPARKLMQKSIASIMKSVL